MLIWHHGAMLGLNIIGCGKVGRVLGRLWSEAGLCAVESVCNRSLESASEAVEFMGAGGAVADIGEMSRAPVWMIAASDRALAQIWTELIESGCLRPGDIVFHCSGAVASSVLLEPAAAVPVSVGSLHPVKTFPVAEDAVTSFAGTWCALEGDPGALAWMTEAVRRIEGAPFTIDARDKVLYHAALVMVCNNLTALIGAGLDLLDRAGVDADRGTRIVAPIVRETLENALRLGPVDSLTGPVVRGEEAVIEAQLRRLETLDPFQAELYRVLGRQALKLASARHDGFDGPRGRIKDLLDSPDAIDADSS
ncbi:MAG: Rossmann-like and DUF2520 domain-containing protein [Gammaproteobacteria bacterium]